MVKAVRVFTDIPKSQIIRNGGTGNWSAARENVSKFPYVICVRHGNRPKSPNDVPHKTAFLIARISDIRDTEALDGTGKPRLFIAFDAYAEINVLDFWGDSQNPVGYVDLDKSGIDVDVLDFIPVTETHFVQAVDRLEVPRPEAFQDRGLSIAEARQGLARRYGIDVRTIDIIFRG